MKLVFVTGGVVSSLGKGSTAASIGALLENQGLKIGMLKLEPYLNVDPGTMSPYQHGEVYVLEDGSETDLDLGHYERFTHAHLTGANSVSSGQIYASIVQKERHRAFGGATVQVIPHVTNEIKQRILDNAAKVDVLVTEIGGVVGDIEGLPFLETLRQIKQEFGRENVVLAHVTLLPFLRASKELKSKPSQHSVAKLRELGLQPDLLLCRTEVPMDASIRGKLSLFCNVPPEAVIEEKDVEHSIYELPICLHQYRVDALILSQLQLPYTDKNLAIWEDVVHRIQHPKNTIRVGIVGDTELQDAYKSVYEALAHAGIANQIQVDVCVLDAQTVLDNPKATLKPFDGIVVTGELQGNLEGQLAAIAYARENQMPFFGIDTGMHAAAIEFARHVLHRPNANTAAMAATTVDPIVISCEANNESTMLLGEQTCRCDTDNRLHALYRAETISERFRNGYCLNAKCVAELNAKGLRCVASHEPSKMVVALELEQHPWFVAVQFHPQFHSKPYKSHPLFVDFARACLEVKNNR